MAFLSGIKLLIARLKSFYFCCFRVTFGFLRTQSTVHVANPKYIDKLTFARTLDEAIFKLTGHKYFIACLSFNHAHFFQSMKLQNNFFVVFYQIFKKLLNIF